MTRYYNPSRGPIPYSLPGGRAGVVPGKSYVEIDRRDEGCASVQALVRKKRLIRMSASSAPQAPRGVPATPLMQASVTDRAVLEDTEGSAAASTLSAEVDSIKNEEGDLHDSP